jgi:hypothetical protein
MWTFGGFLLGASAAMTFAAIALGYDPRLNLVGVACSLAYLACLRVIERKG